MEEGNDYSMMMDLKHENGDPMFNSISVTLMCDACRKANLLECPHMEHEIPHWKRDKKRSKLVQSIMQGDRTMYLRENAGVVAKSENNAFDLLSIDTLLTTDYDLAMTGNLRAPVFVCIDTAGGGASCTAICSGIYTRAHSLLVSGLLQVYVGSRHLSNKRHQRWKFCIGHVDTL
jgi:hypothetical protein